MEEERGGGGGGGGRSGGFNGHLMPLTHTLSFSLPTRQAKGIYIPLFANHKTITEHLEKRRKDEERLCKTFFQKESIKDKLSSALLKKNR